jgi:ABC-type phosphate transport system permease subunit
MTQEPAAGYAETSQATTALVLGILSVVVCQILGPIAWVIGHKELEAIDGGRRPPVNRGMAQAGKILGIVGTALLGLVVLAVIAWVVILVLGISTAIFSELPSR